MDAAIKAIVENLEGVKELNPEFCQKCHQAEYAPFDQLAPEFDCTELYDHEDLQVLLLKAAKKVRAYCIVTPDTSNFFETLRTEGIDIAKLTTFLWYCIDSGLQAEKNKRAFGISIAASSLYMVLSSIKSAKLYRLLDINLFQKCIELFKVTEKLLRPLASKIANISQAKKRGATETERSDPLEIGNQAKDFVELLKDAMRSFYVVLFSHSVADSVLESDERCPILVDFLRDVAYFDLNSSTNYNKRMIDSVNTMEKISDLSFAIAHEVLAKSSELRSLAIASRFVMPYLLFWVCGSAKQALSGSLPQLLKDARTAMVRFLSIRADCMTRVEMECYMKVLKTMPFKCFDRAEYRTNVAETFVDILTIVPPMAYFILDDIFVLGCHSKTQNRSFAYEIVSFLLRKFPFDSLPDPPIPYNALVAEDNTVANMDAVEVAEEVVEEEMPPAEEVTEEQTTENGEASEVNGTNGETEATEQDENEGAPPPPFRQRTTPRRSPDDLEFVRRGMNAKEAMMMLIVNGLIDKFAKQKALQTVEALFKSDSCVYELCKMATKFVNENSEDLNLVDRAPPIKEEPMDEAAQQNEDSMEVDGQANAPEPVIYADDLLHLILKGFENEKTVICKHALSTCCSVLLRASVSDHKLFEKCVEEIRLKTWDVAIQVRKQAAVCLKDLLQDSVIGSLPKVEIAWLSGLLHQVVDNEQTVAQQATKFVTEHIVNGLLKPRPNRAWDLMGIVENDTEYKRYIAICFTEHASNNSGQSQRAGNTIQQLIQQLVRCLVRITGDADCPPAAWMLLSELSHSLTVDPTCAEKAWDRLQFNRSDDRVPIYVAKILANRSNYLKPAVRDALKEKIGKQIMENRIAVPHISAICYAFACLSNGVVPNGGNANREGVKELKKFIQTYNSKVTHILNEKLFVQIRRDIASRAGTVTPSMHSQSSGLSDSALTPEFLMRSVYTVGELIQYASGKIDSKIFNLLRGLVASNQFDLDMQALSQFADSQVAKTVPRSVRAAAVLALGKMCVVDESIATNIVPVFVRQLRQDSDHCVRNIILVAMADICTIGTAAVNTHGDILASCMRDPSVLIRKHAVFLVTTLIRDEYFKWKGQIMYFFLGALLDPDNTVREQVHASLLNVLLPKFPTMLSNHFVEAMFYLNDVVHPSMAVSIKQEQEDCPLARDDRFALFGHSRMEDRMKIYKFMISTFDDTKNLPLMGQIAAQIVESIAEDILDVTDRNVICLLLDAFKIIRSKEIILKMQTGKRAGGIDEIEEEHEEAQQMHAAATDAISNVYMRVMYQEVLLRLFKLSDYLKAKGDSASIELAKNCHSTYLDICVNYREHFDALMGYDLQRRDEIKDDLRRYRSVNLN